MRSLEESAFLVADVARDGEEYLEEATREIGKKRDNLKGDFFRNRTLQMELSNRISLNFPSSSRPIYIIPRHATVDP